MRKKNNRMYIKFPAIPENERMARMIAAAFITNMNPTLEEMDDVKTAVSEAVTNCIIHAYGIEERENAEIEMFCEQEGQEFIVVISDQGKGIENISLAMEPLYTTKPSEERSGMGFSFMEAFMNQVDVESEPGHGTKVTMKKRIGNRGE